MTPTDEEIKALVKRLKDRAKRMNGALVGMSDGATYALGYYDQFAATGDSHAADALKAERDEKIARALAKADYEAERAGDIENENDDLKVHHDRLERALRPFADAADSYDGESDEMLVSGASLRAKHLRAARAALSGSSDPRKDVARRCVEILRRLPGDVDFVMTGPSGILRQACRAIASEFSLDTTEGRHAI